uniref:hypothetical protein n=1 Tax=Desulfoluna sp. TaxID=2045199 RepID=UPI0026019883
AQQSVSFTPALRLFVPARRSLAPDTPRQSLGARKSDENTKVAETMIKAKMGIFFRSDVDLAFYINNCGNWRWVTPDIS